MKKFQLKKSFKTLLAVLAFTALSFQHVNAQKLITVKSAKNYEATVDAIKKGVADAGMMVLAEINHGKILSMTGLSVNAQSIFIGNPNVGKEVFSDNKAVGLAIPIRLNVYEENGITYINYFTPSSELGNFKGDKVKSVGGQLDKKIEMLTTMVSK